LDKRIKIYIGIFILIVSAIYYADAIKQKPINWFPSYVSKHKIPYGTYVLKKELPFLFPNTKIREINQSPFLFLKDTTVNGTYFFVDSAVNFGEEEFHKLLDFVKRGNDVFLSTNGAQIDTLGMKTSSFYSTALKEKVFVSLENPLFNNKEYSFNRNFTKLYFTKIDTVKTTVLGSILIRDEDDVQVEKEINFVKRPFGKGNFYIHTFPLAFTNYAILDNSNNQYTASVLSYLDENKPILLDAYYKTGKSKITSPLYYLLSSKNLKWAYYIALIGVLFFIVFKGKRMQRLIPIILPLKNQTIAFTRTIAGMYYEKSEHKSIAEHKIHYFLDYIRLKLRIPTLIMNDSFYNHLALRSGNTKEDVVKLFKIIKAIQQKDIISTNQLIALNVAIEEFKNKKI